MLAVAGRGNHVALTSAARTIGESQRYNESRISTELRTIAIISDLVALVTCLDDGTTQTTVPRRFRTPLFPYYLQTCRRSVTINED